MTIEFDNSDKNQRPAGYENMDKITVSRSIENNKVKCIINSRVESQDKVKNLFRSVKLNVDNPHFLIM